LLTGFIAGLVCVAPGPLLNIFSLTGALLTIFTLIWCVGPSFFIAVVAGIIITGAQRHLQTNLLHYLAGLVVCFVTYLLAFFVFWVVYGFSPDWFGFRQSANFESFGVDGVLGLVAAAPIAAGGIAFFAFVLTGRWSNTLLARLLLAGIVTIIITFIVNYPFQSYWPLFGVLIPLGNALCSAAVGAHLWQPFESGRQITGAEGRTTSPAEV